MRIAVKRGGTLYHLHGDHLGSTSLTTRGSSTTASRTYYAYGSERAATGDLQTDRTFTGQKRDATGLFYYNARYYDPALGTFISPDSMVPGAGQVINYNRFLYARGNPLKYSEPNGHASAEAIREWEHKNRWYNARGWFSDGGHWSRPGKPVITKRQNAEEVLEDAGIETEGSWPDDKLIELAEGISAFAKRIERVPNHRKVNGLAHIDSLVEGTVKWRRKSKGTGLCAINDPNACAWPDGAVEFYDSFFDGNLSDIEIRGIAVHEMAHLIDFDPASTRRCQIDLRRCVSIDATAWKYWATAIKKGDDFDLTTYASTWHVEYWAEAVAIWVFEGSYPGIPTDLLQRGYIQDVFDWVEDIVGP